MAEGRKTDKTDAELKRLRQAADGKKAMSDYEAEAAATRAKTERLRALRLARDAAAPPPPAKAPARGKSVKATKVPLQPLADWLTNQKKDGMRD